VTFTGAFQKIFSPNPRLGFLAQAHQLQGAIGAGAISFDKVRAAQTQIFNAQLDAALCFIFLALVTTILLDSLRVWFGILRGTQENKNTEAPFVAASAEWEEL
jgi:carbon starvation protein